MSESLRRIHGTSGNFLANISRRVTFSVSESAYLVHLADARSRLGWAERLYPKDDCMYSLPSI